LLQKVPLTEKRKKRRRKGLYQTGASHDQATSSLRDAGGDLVDAMLLLENSNMLI
jgi:hypothetical protein